MIDVLQIFTFIVPGTVTTDLVTDVYSRDFTYGHQRWCICLVPYDKAVGAYLTLRNAVKGATVAVDFSFTMLNKVSVTTLSTVQLNKVSVTRRMF